MITTAKKGPEQKSFRYLLNAYHGEPSVVVVYSDQKPASAAEVAALFGYVELEGDENYASGHRDSIKFLEAC